MGQHNLCLDERGEILNNAMFKSNNCAEYVAKSGKVRRIIPTMPALTTSSKQPQVAVFRGG